MEFLPLKNSEDPGEEIEKSLCTVEAAFGVALTVHDLHGRLLRRNGEPLLPGRHLHPHPCCLRDRFRESGWSSRCFKDCFTQAEMIADSQAQPYLKNCWKGLRELVVPIFHNSQHLLTLYAGVFRGGEEPPDGAPTQKWFRRLYSTLPVMDEQKMQSLSGVLEMLGHGIIAIGMRQEAYDGPDAARAAALTGFLADNAHRQINLADLARHLHLSPSRTAHLAVELTGKNFQSLLLEERMVRARHLLRTTAQKQEEISGAVGFKNCYYFNRAFKKYFGETPGRYRNQGRKR